MDAGDHTQLLPEHKADSHVDWSVYVVFEQKAATSSAVPVHEAVAYVQLSWSLHSPASVIAAHASIVA